MTDAQKLEALIQRAIEGGWDGEAESGPDGLVFFQAGDVDVLARSFEQIIFNHDFARALFGEEEICYECTEYRLDEDKYVDKEYGCDNEDYYENHKTGKRFKFHLQQAVISDNRIEYFYQAVFGGEK